MPPRLNLPPVTRALLLLLLFQSVLSGVVRYRQWSSSTDVLVVPYLTLVPSMSLLYPWTFLTSTFVDANVFTLGISGLTLWHGGRYLERAWTSTEFAKFVALVALIPNAFTFATLVVLYAMTGNVMWALIPISGTTALQIAFLTGISQLLPTHTVTLFRGVLSLRLPRLPLIHLLLVTFLAILPIYSAASPLLAASGFLTAWTHLRFLRRPLPDLDSAGPLRGDASDAFALSQFFPEPARPAIDAAANLFGRLGIAPAAASREYQGGGGGGGGGGGVRTAQSGRAENERRRALALKQLDQRLQDATAARAGKATMASTMSTTTQPGGSVEGGVDRQPAAVEEVMQAPGGAKAGGEQV